MDVGVGAGGSCLGCSRERKQAGGVVSVGIRGGGHLVLSCSLVPPYLG